MKKLFKVAVLAMVMACLAGSPFSDHVTSVYADQGSTSVDLEDGNGVAGLALISDAGDTVSDSESDNKETATKATDDKTESGKADAEEEEALLLTPDVSVALNIRKTPDADGKIVGQIFRGCTAEVIKKNKHWYKIKSGNVTGWVSAEYCKTGKKAEKLLKKVDPKVAKVTATSLNLRKEKSTGSDVVALLKEGTEYMVIHEGKEWVEIQYTSQTSGFVAAEYVKVKDKAGQAISAKAMEHRSKAIRREERKRAKEAAKKEAARRAAEAAKQGSSGSSSSGGSSSGSSASSDDVVLLAALCQHEAGTNYEGCLAVANVVLNRKRSSSYPNTIRGVIFQSGQFAGVNSGALNRFLSGPNSNCMAAARAALAGSNNIGGRMQFRSARSTGYHSGGINVGGNIFF